ncbi:alpha/beta hydrolase, partial [Planctomycetota bacterium]
MKPIFLIALILVLAAHIPAEEALPLSVSPQVRLAQLQQEYKAAVAAEDWAKADAALEGFLKIEPRHTAMIYNRVCVLCRIPEKTKALNLLSKLSREGFDDVTQVEADKDLDAIRKDKRFKAILVRIKKNFKKGYEKGKPMPGIKTLEGAPAGGLPYRLRMDPAATKEKPHHLIIWLHPTGASMNGPIEEQAPFFIKRGFALCVFPKKDFRAWTSNDAIRLFNTLNHLKSVAGIDKTRRPVFFGYSAGGQLTLRIWTMNPNAIGGMILLGTWPTLMGPDRKPMAVLPREDKTLKHPPIYILIGAKEQGSGYWQRVAPEYEKRGASLTIRIIEGKGHVWLMTTPELKRIGQWMDEHFSDQPAAGVDKEAESEK